MTFFEELTDSLSRAINNFNHIILIGEFNIDIKRENSIAYNTLEEFCDTFNLTNLVKSETCFINNHKSAIDLILTNKPRSFQITNVTDTGVRDCHKLITTFMKSYIFRLKPKNVHYRSYKTFNEESFLSKVKEADFSFKASNPNENYSVLTNVFSNIVSIHVPLKKKILRGKDAPFMNKELRKVIYTRSNLRNRYFKNPTKENETSYKKQRNKCVSLRRKSITQYFSKITSKVIMANKQFWKAMIPFLTNKGCLENNDIILRDGEEVIANDKILAKHFNEHYVNTVESSSGFKPSKMSFSAESRINNHFLKSIANQYKDHPSIVNIRKNALNNTHLGISSFSTEEVTPDKVNSIIKSLDANKAPGTYKIPMKLIILASDFLSKPISKALNNCITSCTFPENAKCHCCSD